MSKLFSRPETTVGKVVRRTGYAAASVGALATIACAVDYGLAHAHYTACFGPELGNWCMDIEPDSQQAHRALEAGGIALGEIVAGTALAACAGAVDRRMIIRAALANLDEQLSVPITQAYMDTFPSVPDRPL